MFLDPKIVKNLTLCVKCFELFFGRDLIDHALQETSRYAQQYQNSRDSLFPMSVTFEVLVSTKW